MRFALAILLVACGSSVPAGAPDAAVDGGGPPAPDAAPLPDATPAMFPLRIEGRHLVDGANRPFLLHGDTAWSLIVQLDDTELEQYLSARRSLGFNTLLVSVIENHFSDDPPKNAAGQAPFTTPGDVTTPNPAYFAHVDHVLERAEAHGFLVLLTFAYLGFGGGNEGWYSVLTAQTPAELMSYGSFLGARYKDVPNLVWVAGGDYDPPNKQVVRDLVAGIQSQDPNHLVTVHTGPESAPLTYWSGESWIDLDNVYTYGDVATEAREAFGRSGLPFFLIETTYENEHGVTRRALRGQAWGALLSGAMGQIFGNAPIWCFGPVDCFNWTGPAAWPGQLMSPGARDQAVVRAVMESLPWPALVPSTTLVTSGGTGTVAAVGGGVGVIYLPSARTIGVDVAQVGAGAVASWIDPTTGARQSAGPTFTTPAGGDGDWLLLLDAR